MKRSVNLKTEKKKLYYYNNRIKRLETGNQPRNYHNTDKMPKYICNQCPQMMENDVSKRLEEN